MPINPYGETIADHARHPRNYGSLESPDVRHEDVNPFCGDRVRIELRVRDGNIIDVRFQGDLCVIAKAAGSLVTEMVKGMSFATVQRIGEQQMLDALGAPIQPARRKCALLPLQVLQAATR
ncbi:MAG TPA: iron-sulfur cluster assembly scaffold protein [Thermoanaerobaculia bacterium]|nr:iron-sulfur cluster assembly scaffold protein [Thermoanaerobaculia bacterium]